LERNKSRSYPELDLNLSDEEKAVRDLMRKFGREVARPGRDRTGPDIDPADVIAEGSVLWDVFKKWREWFKQRILYREDFP
jgi:hypothetical protein